MLAALFVEERVAGHALPQGMKSFAEYARQRRKAACPGSVQIKESLWAIFLAILNAEKQELTNPEAGQRFVDAWRRMASVILKAAAEKISPFSKPLFSKNEEFEEARASLAADRKKYHLDMLAPRGEQWTVDIPDWPRDRPAPLLRQPKSLLFAPWSRRKEDCGADQPFEFLAVDGSNGYWVFSADPELDLRLDTLAEVLQKAEVEHDPTAAQEKRWELRHSGTMVASLPTKLPSEKVLRVVERWAHAAVHGSPFPSGPSRGPLGCWQRWCLWEC